MATLRATEVESVTDLDARAFALKQDLGLKFSKSYYVDWSGFNEKWMLGNNGWYFVTPDGGLYRATSGTSLAAMPLIAQLDASYYDDPSLIHDAQVSGVMLDQQLIHEVANLGLHVQGTDWQNWGGMNEKWVLSDAGKWYFVTPDGTLYQWAGSTNVAASTVVAHVGACCYVDPDMLHDASLIGSFSAELAHELDASLGLRFSGSYATNWGGLSEKWIRGDGNDWYFITPSGGFYEWSGGKSLANSRLLATLDVSYYTTPSRLHDSVAPLASTANVQAAFAALDREVSVDGAGAASSRAANFDFSAVEQQHATDGGHSHALVKATGRSLGSSGDQRLTSLGVVRRSLESDTTDFDDAARNWAFGDPAASLADRFNWLVDVTADGDLASLQLAFAELGGARE